MPDTEAIPRGTVFLVEEDAGDDSGERAWCGYWDASPEGSGWLEDAGRHPSLTSALAWARSRSSRVLVRYEGASDYLWAGAGAPPAGILPLREPE
jgi:hypothetical protein